MKSWRRQALFQGRHCFCPTPTLDRGGGGSSQGGRHPLTALSTSNNISSGVEKIFQFETFPPKNVSIAQPVASVALFPLALWI